MSPDHFSHPQLIRFTSLIQCLSLIAAHYLGLNLINWIVQGLTKYAICKLFRKHHFPCAFTHPASACSYFCYLLTKQLCYTQDVGQYLTMFLQKKRKQHICLCGRQQIWKSLQCGEILFLEFSWGIMNHFSDISKHILFSGYLISIFRAFSRKAENIVGMDQGSKLQLTIIFIIDYFVDHFLD